jgi:2-methylisocitrate lyase-like PEP mutase family enzyme
MTGAGTAASAGYPDYGLLTMSEMVTNAARLTEVVDLPLIADADTGYGNELNVVRTVRAYARAGVAALHIEDQAFPKRCGHLAGKEIVARDEWLRKIRAAVECRPDNDLMVIARTDARAVAGFDEAVERARGALEAGADMVFVEAPETLEEIEAVPRLVEGPCLFNVIPGGRSPEVSFAQLQTWGYRLAICPGALLWPVVAACDTALRALGEQAGVTPTIADKGPAGDGPAALFHRVGAADWDALRQRFAAGEAVDGTGV